MNLFVFFILGLSLATAAWTLVCFVFPDYSIIAYPFYFLGALYWSWNSTDVYKKYFGDKK